MTHSGNVSPLLQDNAQQAKRWLLENAAPLWASRGRTKSGLFAERISLQGQADTAYFRLLVQARHIFAFSAIGQMGWGGPWRERIEETMKVILKEAQRNDGLFVHKLDVHARPIDRRADLYDQAFVLLAMGKAGKALNQPWLFDEAENLLNCLDATWSHPLGGYYEGEIAHGSVRRQNPHMHLLEAYLLLHKASGRHHFLAKAEEIARLCRDYFIDSTSGALLESFGQDWTPLDGVDGQISEPGHCFEWAWLFEWLYSLGWSEGADLSDRLCAFARRNGIDTVRGVAIGSVLIGGAIYDGNARLWPQAERIKAAIARFRRLGEAQETQEAIQADAGLKRYLDIEIGGLWRDKLTEHNRWIDEPAPGSSLYHISCAYEELSTIIA